jgi:hypothetical protein
MPRGEERRKVIRRESDRILMDTINYLVILMDELGAKEYVFQERLRAYMDSCIFKGRRAVDRRKEALVFLCLEEISKKLKKLGLIKDIPRKVKVTKIEGIEVTEFPLDSPQLGLEKGRPVIGDHYFLYKDDGQIYRTSRVREVERDLFKTPTSTYHREEIVLDIFE